MRPHPQGQIRPKISTMPRQKTEAAAYLEIYKLVNEKKRLQQELETLEQRRDRIQQRLQVLEVEVTDLKKSAEQLGDGKAGDRTPAPSGHSAAPTTDSSSFNTLFLEY